MRTFYVFIKFKIEIAKTAQACILKLSHEQFNAIDAFPILKNHKRHSNNFPVPTYKQNPL